MYHMTWNERKSIIPLKDVERIRSLHHEGVAHEYFHRTTGGAYVGDAVFGANDGIITTFAVVAGVAGADLSSAVVLILGVANLLGDGFSMAAGNYLGRKSEDEYQAVERAKEEWEVEHMPDEERQEVRKLYEAKGFSGQDLERAVAVVTSDKKVWVNEMMAGEHGIIGEGGGSPVRNAGVTFASFVVAGAVPLLPYVFGLTGYHAFGWSTIAAACALFLVGSLRTFITERRWWLAGLEMLGVGAIAAAVAYAVGAFLSRIV